MAIPIKELPNLSPLVFDYHYSYDRVSGFFNGNFRSLEALRQQAEKIRGKGVNRERLAAILTEQNQRYGCGRPTLDNIKALTRDQACAVVTGQQVGLFSGPLYTVYKAMTAVKLAEYLNTKNIGRYVPVFWLACEDHDFAEINHIVLLNRLNEVQDIRFRTEASGTRTPASKIVLTPEIMDCIRHLEEATHDSEFKPEITSDLNAAYKPGRSISEAFALWMTRLFRSYGLIFIDPSHRGLKELGKPVFLKEIAEGSPSTERAAETTEKLNQRNYSSQVQLRQGLLNVFFAEQGRQTILMKNNGFLLKDTGDVYKKDEFLDLLDKSAHVFSPNVLLRPVYQDAVLPTVAYVGGPGEIAYFAQMKGIYESFRLEMPVIYPRKTVTIVERKVDSVLKRFELSLQDIWYDFDSAVRHITGSQIPETVKGAIQAARLHIEQDLNSIKREMLSFDPNLAKSADMARGKIDHQVRFLEKKILQSYRKRTDAVTGQLRKARNSLYPLNRLQERVFNVVPFLFKYGYSFIDSLYGSIDIESFDHQVIKL